VCLGIPGQFVERVAGYEDQLAVVDVVGGRRHVNVGMLADEPLEPGDWVLIHVGFAVEKVDEETAQQARAGLELMGQPREVVREDRS
jgi:hydrogenase assembly chaperone HypC/HupF